MPIYKQYKYHKERDCFNCRFWKNERCRHPCPNDFNCTFKLLKTWTRKYFFKTSLNGRSFIRRGFSSKEAARDAETDFRRESLGEKTFRSYLVLPGYKESLLKFGESHKNLKPQYYHKVINKINNYYITLFPDVNITKLTPLDAERVRKKIDKENNKTSTKNEKLSFLKRFFTWVEEAYQYRYNPIFLQGRFNDYSIKRQKKEQVIVSFSQFIEIYKYCNDEYYQLILLTLFIFGYRTGELLALTASSIDFTDNTIEIYQEVSFKGGKGIKNYELTSPKTPASERIQTMPGIYIEKLKKHLEKHSLKGNDFIFFRYMIKRKDIPLHENTYRHRLEKYCKSYNPNFHPHMLRTSICTHLREKGVPIEEVSRYLGHGDIRVTEKYYSKVSNEKKELLNKAIDEILQKIM